MSNNYLVCKIDAIDEILYAFLGDFEFESFEELDNCTLGYIKSHNVNDHKKNEINHIIENLGYSYSWAEVADKNWNELWESNFEAVIVENVCRIRAEFHDHDASFRHEIVIQPKMAFGTGHHETTYMMILNMSQMDFADKEVFDYGAGTGILSIYASMLGASRIDALDIEEESYKSTIENSNRNERKNITSFQGDISVMEDRIYDIILANINRNVLLDSVVSLSKMIKKNGIILLSGILDSDIGVITSTFESVGFKSVKIDHRGSWTCMKMIML